MDDLYKSNQLYKTIDLFCKLRLISKSAMCSKAGVSPGIISDLKFGRKQTIQIETAAKMAKALDTTVSAIESNLFVVGKWDVETTLKWHDCDSDEERIQILYDYGVDTTVILMKEYRKFADRVILQNPNPYEQKNSPTPEGVERIPNYSKLSDTNKAIVDSMIAQLLAAQLED